MEDLRLNELTNADGISVSPFVWRVKFALQAKGLEYQSAAISFFGIQALAGRFGSNLRTVPILARRHVTFRKPAELSMVKFFDEWFGTQVLRPMF